MYHGMERRDDGVSHLLPIISEQDLAGRDVAALYAAWWDIENLFRETTSENLLGGQKSRNDAIPEIKIRLKIHCGE